jgi:glycosyltransferase involved in cell wall biosynthesis
MRENGKTITLCMIVKDETHIIEECLRSMAKYIDRYDITDTGSTDGTPELIKKTMDELGIPGEVHLSDWKGFGDHANRIGSRTEAFHNAENSGADYAWVIDADDYIEGEFEYPKKMDADGYTLLIKRGDFSWWRNQIFKLDLGWRYVGILHEYADATKKSPVAFEKIGGNYHISARTEGNRNVGITPIEKYSRDAETLLGAIEDEPDNARYHFYLAQSYFDSQQWEKSKEAYRKRVEMGGWNEEVFYSQYRVGLICAIMQEPPEVTIHEFMLAYNIRPIRAEPLVEISKIYRSLEKPAAAYVFAKQAYETPYPAEDILFISEDVYSYAALDEISATAFYAGRALEGYNATKKLLQDKLIPEAHIKRVTDNMEQYEKVMAGVQQQQMQANMEEQMKKIQEKKKLKEQSNSYKTKYKKKKARNR